MENDGFFEMVFILVHLVLVGEILVLSDGCQVSDVWVCERRFSILSQLSMGSLETWRISFSLRKRNRQPCNTPHILVLRLVATYAIALTVLLINKMVDIELNCEKRLL